METAKMNDSAKKTTQRDSATKQLFAKLAKQAETTDKIISQSRPIGPLKFFGIRTGV